MAAVSGPVPRICITGFMLSARMWRPISAFRFLRRFARKWVKPIQALFAPKGRSTILP